MFKAKLLSVILVILSMSHGAMGASEPLLVNPNDVEGIEVHGLIKQSIYLKMKSGTEIYLSNFLDRSSLEREKSGLQLKLDNALREDAMLAFSEVDKFGDRRVTISNRKTSEPVVGNQYKMVQEQLKALTERVNKLEAEAAKSN